jgi:hypothetical protein
MHFLWLLSYFFGGIFAANAIPHFVAGAMGHPFQSPFAKPPGEGLSSSTVNVLWGSLNALIAWLLIARVGFFDWRLPAHALPVFCGAVLITLFSSRHFGKFHGGNLSSRS